MLSPPAYPADALGPESLQVELSTVKRLFSPIEPIWLRLTLNNPTDQVIEIDADGQALSQAVGLPPALIYGVPGAPGLTMAWEREAAVAMNAPASAASAPAASEPATPLRIGPRASIGAELNLREAHQLTRYAGEFHVKWAPFGSRGPSATVSFRIEARSDAILSTDYGKVRFELFYERAPINVENFLDLVRQRFYNGTSFHRLIPNFIVQGGSPDGTSNAIRPDGRMMPPEFTDVPFDIGTLAMAHKPNDPDSASCQFFISLARNPELDGNYTAIGQARDEESLRTLKAISELPADERGRPRRPVVIRFITLVEAGAGQTRVTTITTP